MEEESKFRVEAPEEEEKEKTGLFRPLPEIEQPTTSKKGKVEPIVKLLGVSMTEKRRDRIVMILMPLLVGIIDAYVYSEIVVLRFDSTGFSTFVIPLLLAIPVGLVIERTSQSLIAALLITVFFLVFFMLFLVSPALLWQGFDFGQWFLSGLVVAAVYVLLVILASLLGALIGALMREFI